MAGLVLCSAVVWLGYSWLERLLWMQLASAVCQTAFKQSGYYYVISRVLVAVPVSEPLP